MSISESLREFHVKGTHPFDARVSRPELYIGIMSGTSLDGVDAVLVDLISSQPQLLAKHYLPFDDALKNTLLALHQPGRNELHQAQLTGNELARLYAAATAAVLQTANISRDQVQAIGCHGQTIRHCPDLGYTLQLGNAALLAELAGITVVSDFRSRDIAAGGQGAPLVPAFHDQVLRHPDIHRVIVNIGGISNLTNLPPDRPATGFDCGPGNLLMDAWCVRHLAKPHDENGAWAASGKTLPALLEQMLCEPFFSLPPPKSSGRDLFNMTWLRNKLTGKANMPPSAMPVSPTPTLPRKRGRGRTNRFANFTLNGSERTEDVQATLLELTCLTIAQSIRQHCAGVKEIYLCGGGAHNLTLRNRLAALLADCTVQTTDTLGVDGDYLEAIAFAWLAQQTLHGKPANLPLVTGAKHPCILGAVYRNS